MAIWFDSLTIRTCPGSSADVGGGGVKLAVSVKRKVQSGDDGEVSEVASLRVSYSILCIFRNPMLLQAPMLLLVVYICFTYRDFQSSVTGVECLCTCILKVKSGQPLTLLFSHHTG